jgi:putative PIG3 family NAD(P)H quinone oxidoreductase
MRAVTVPTPGGPEALILADLPDPEPGPGEVVLDVVASAVNRADLLQRRGFYPPPPGASDILGLECAGTVRSVGPDVDGWETGDEACALLAGGGYAEQVVVPAGQLMRVPAGVPLAVAGALPEVACTVWSNVFMVAHLQPGEILLVHGGAGGIGSCAIQLATALGARVFATAGSPEKLELCRTLGAELAISYRDEGASGIPLWVEVLGEAGGADVILDNMGAKYLDHNVAALATEGRLAIIGMQGGTKGALDLGVLMSKRAAVVATTLRARPTAEKAAICRAVEEHVWPLVEAGQVRPVVGAEIALADVAEAHALMEAGGHTGKIVLRV